MTPIRKRTKNTIIALAVASALCIVIPYTALASHEERAREEALVEFDATRAAALAQLDSDLDAIRANMANTSRETVLACAAAADGNLSARSACVAAGARDAFGPGSAIAAAVDAAQSRMRGSFEDAKRDTEDRSAGRLGSLRDTSPIDGGTVASTDEHADEDADPASEAPTDESPVTRMRAKLDSLGDEKRGAMGAKLDGMASSRHDRAEGPAPEVAVANVAAADPLDNSTAPEVEEPPAERMRSKLDSLGDSTRSRMRAKLDGLR